MDLRDAYFVDGVRAWFGKARPDGFYWTTRADDMVSKIMRELIRRNRYVRRLQNRHLLNPYYPPS